VYRWQMLAAVAAAIVGAASLGFAFHADGSTDQEMELVASQGTASGTLAFTVQATPVEGLYPGAVRKLKLTMTNPYDFDLNVVGLQADLVTTSNPGCEPIATNLEVQAYTGTFPVRVAADDSEDVGSVPLHMPNTVANECQKAVFTIKLSADATRVDR
jgi:hypothetical protein